MLYFLEYSDCPKRAIGLNCGTTPPDPPGKVFENATNVDIPDNGPAVTSDIAVTGQTGNAPATLKVDVDIKHTFRGDLVIDLVAPDGSTYRLKASSTSDSADNVIATYTVNASSEVANGTWQLKVQDTYNADTGYIDLWRLTF
ncbi:proprotein convertase P-domain-containing protein [Actinokineospora auranticolor]|uniref:proprotein convertase P-domain-containing protein n=1 Tax=Actinokineospora auranticolor TaxID=155976 RepID=UPI003CCBB976